jgi:hypothetical protein
MSAQYSPYLPGIVKTPEIQLGDGNRPSVVNVPPVVVVSQGVDSYDEWAPEEGTAQPYAPPPPAGAPPGMAPGMGGPYFFDYLVSPVGYCLPGSMEDSSISLGEYARELRSRPPGPPPVVLNPQGNPSSPQ